MSWNRPANVVETAESVRQRWPFHNPRQSLAGDYVAVLSYAGMADRLDTSHPLSDHVLTGAEAYRDHYLSTSGPDARTPHPSTVVYYVRDTTTGRVVLAVQADGTVLDELAELRPDLRPGTRSALRDAIARTPRWERPA